MLGFGLPTGRVDLSAIPLSMGYPTGDTRNDPNLYDDRILRQARNAAGKQSAQPALNTAGGLSFPGYVPTSTNTAAGANLSYGKNVPKSSPGLSGLFGVSSVADFIATASSGVPIDTRKNPDMYDDQILRTNRNQQSSSPWPEVHTANVDGGASNISGLKSAAQAIFERIGGTGDPDLQAIPVSYGGDQGAGNSNFLVIAGLAAAAGLAYLAFAK